MKYKWINNNNILGFRCCSNPNAVVYETTEDGQWSIENVENSEYYGIEWCGIVRSSEIEVPEEVITI